MGEHKTSLWSIRNETTSVPIVLKTQNQVYLIQNMFHMF